MGVGRVGGGGWGGGGAVRGQCTARIERDRHMCDGVNPITVRCRYSPCYAIHWTQNYTVGWGGVGWDGVGWDEVGWGGLGCDAMRWDGVAYGM
jgi:hypothetical protein